MAARDIIVVGASAGGIEAVRGLVELLPSDLPASPRLNQAHSSKRSLAKSQENSKSARITRQVLEKL